MDYQIVEVGGRKLKVRATYSHYVKLMKMYPDMAQAEQWSAGKMNEFVLDALWLMLKKGFMFKPFVFKSRLRDELTIAELKNLHIAIPQILMGESLSEDAVKKK